MSGASRNWRQGLFAMAGSSLKGQAALITGAAKRIGRATALALAAEGVNIVVHYRSAEEEAQALCREVAQHGVQAWAVGGDLAKPEEVETLLPRALDAAGSLDILVNNASIFPPTTLENVRVEDLALNAQVNAWAPFVLSRAFARRVGRGKIVNLLDARIAGYDWSHVAYILSKHLLAVLTRMTALEFAPGITVNAVAPGLILPPPGQDDAFLDRLVNTVPLKRHGDPGDIAEAIVYLVKSDFLTGVVIHVDGGRHLREIVHGPYPD